MSRDLESSLELAETFVGTFTYFSPERIRGEPYSSSCDVWAAALSILATYLGNFPFDISSNQEEEEEGGRDGGLMNKRDEGSYWKIMKIICEVDTTQLISTIIQKQQQQSNYTDPNEEEERGGMSEEFQDFILICLKKDPSERPTASEILDHPFLSPYLSIHKQQQTTTQDMDDKNELGLNNEEDIDDSNAQGHVQSEFIPKEVDVCQLLEEMDEETNELEIISQILEEELDEILLAFQNHFVNLWNSKHLDLESGEGQPDLSLTQQLVFTILNFLFTSSSFFKVPDISKEKICWLSHQLGLPPYFVKRKVSEVVTGLQEQFNQLIDQEDVSS